MKKYFVLRVLFSFLLCNQIATSKGIATATDTDMPKDKVKTPGYKELEPFFRGYVDGIAVEEGRDYYRQFANSASPCKYIRGKKNCKEAEIYNLRVTRTIKMRKMASIYYEFISIDGGEVNFKGDYRIYIERIKREVLALKAYIQALNRMIEGKMQELRKEEGHLTVSDDSAESDHLYGDDGFPPCGRDSGFVGGTGTPSPSPSDSAESDRLYGADGFPRYGCASGSCQPSDIGPSGFLGGTGTPSPSP